MKTLGLIAATGIVVVLIFFGVENIRGKRAWENFKKEWEAKGEVFDYKQIVPKTVPSEKNFAHIPLLKPLHDYKWNEDLMGATPIDQKKHDQDAIMPQCYIFFYLVVIPDSPTPMLRISLRTKYTVVSMEITGFFRLGARMGNPIKFRCYRRPWIFWTFKFSIIIA